MDCTLRRPLLRTALTAAIGGNRKTAAADIFFSVLLPQFSLSKRKSASIVLPENRRFPNLLYAQSAFAFIHCRYVSSGNSSHRFVYLPTTFVRLPIFSIVQVITSPGFKKHGGTMPIPTPAGVPVAMIVPACSVIPADSSAIAPPTV